MTRNDLTFIAGCVIFLAGLAHYAYFTRGTIWTVPSFIVILGGAAVFTVALTREKYGEVSSDRVLKVALYTIGINVAGSALFAIGSAILRATR